MKRSKTSSTRPSALLISARTASSTMELKTSGRSPDSRWVAFTCSMASCALATVSMKGSVTRTKSNPENWVSSDEPRASTVIPVRSETKKTLLRWVIGAGKLARVRYNYKFHRAASLPKIIFRMANRYVLPLETLRMADVSSVGGKNASLGELISQLAATGVRVPGGFATTAQAFDDFLAHNNLVETIGKIVAAVDVDDVGALGKAGAQVRAMVERAAFPPEVEKQIRDEYERVAGASPASFAVRSSATAEDLPDASFAGQQETYLNIRGVENILDAVRRVF